MLIVIALVLATLLVLKEAHASGWLDAALLAASANDYSTMCHSGAMGPRRKGARIRLSCHTWNGAPLIDRFCRHYTCTLSFHWGLCHFGSQRQWCPCIRR